MKSLNGPTFADFTVYKASSLNGKVLGDGGMFIYVPSAVTLTQPFRNMVSLLSLMRRRLIPELGALLGRLTFIVDDEYASFKSADCLATADACDEGLLALDNFVIQLFGEHEGLRDFYSLRGISALVRPHSCYSEGGVVRKALRKATLPAPRGFYYYVGYNDRKM